MVIVNQRVSRIYVSSYSHPSTINLRQFVYLLSAGFNVTCAPLNNQALQRSGRQRAIPRNCGLLRSSPSRILTLGTVRVLHSDRHGLHNVVEHRVLTHEGMPDGVELLGPSEENSRLCHFPDCPGTTATLDR